MQTIKSLKQKNSSKIVLCVLDGLGGLPVNGKSELEFASTPNLDAISKHSALGLQHPVSVGITPGSGAAHLGLFGYDPLVYDIGRGVLEVLGLGLEMTSHDLAIRGNFATVEYEDGKPIVTDRRAGRISTQENQRITEKIGSNIDEIHDVKVSITSGLEHRFALILSFPLSLPETSDDISDTDPQEVGKPPIIPKGRNITAQKVAKELEKIINEIVEVIKDEKKANYILLRGISTFPKLPTYEDRYGLNAGCIATYPMYKGVSKLVGMEVLEVKGDSIESEVDTLIRDYDSKDFFYMHIKKTDSYGEDGNFEAKAKVIEEFDAQLPRILKLSPEVLLITGDHSTPAAMKAHSWHPVPVLLQSKHCFGNNSSGFSENGCRAGELGIFKSTDLMPLMLAHGGRLKKYGA
ncbi:MAG: 2,3-bisphosphoglycerate-independent phosphoglycerate mutase [Candidatus Dadabacteria bacterium]|nr:2,3-bisphosphoglycerate-independent phosphoglycerate mutase [Candidatus Dadabacteria bacterium]